MLARDIWASERYVGQIVGAHLRLRHVGHAGIGRFGERVVPGGRAEPLAPWPRTLPSARLLILAPGSITKGGFAPSMVEGSQGRPGRASQTITGGGDSGRGARAWSSRKDNDVPDRSPEPPTPSWVARGMVEDVGASFSLANGRPAWSSASTRRAPTDLPLLAPRAGVVGRDRRDGSQDQGRAQAWARRRGAGQPVVVHMDRPSYSDSSGNWPEVRTVRP